MGVKRVPILSAILVALGLSACGDHNNLLGALADEDSRQAKMEEGQIALDRGDCPTAIERFTELFNEDPDDLDIRLNLAAAYACRAGFIVTDLIRVAADFISSDQTADDFHLFKGIADAAVRVVSPTWDPDTQTAIDLLEDPALSSLIPGCDPAPFANHPDAAFNRGILSTIRAVMAVSSLEQTLGGDINTAAAQFAPTAVLVGDALRDADESMVCANGLVGGTSVAQTDLAQAIHELHVGSNGLDGDLENPLLPADFAAYLINQGYLL